MQNLNILSVILFKYDQEKPLKVHETYNLSLFYPWQKPSVKEACSFASRTVVSRIKKSDFVRVEGILSKESSQLNDYVCFADIRPEGICISFVTHKEYPTRIALQLSSKIYEEWKKLGVNMGEVKESYKLYNFPSASNIIQDFDNPQNKDKIMKIQILVEETKKVITKNIVDLLARGEKIETLVARSEELSSITKTFFTDAKKLNKCCQCTIF